MVSDLRALAECLEMSAPDIRLNKIMHAEQEHIREALATVGQYVIEDDGRIYVITPPETAPAKEK
jgi:hypothetical protein